VALSIGVWLAYRNINNQEDRDKAKDQWVEAALKTSAMILVITGLGGSLSAILRGTPAVDFIAAMFTDYGLPTILLPFVLGIIGNMITGSTTVGVITAASLVAPMLGNLALSPEAAMLAGASGSVIIKYVNSSYFWVCTSLSRLISRGLYYVGVRANLETMNTQARRAQATSFKQRRGQVPFVKPGPHALTLCRYRVESDSDNWCHRQL
jgi:gluconate:H+ symporter, GntP family